MKFVPNGSIVKFLLIAALGCGLAFLVAWLTTMFAVIKLTQGISLAGVSLILLWCVVIGGAAVWSICALCALSVGAWRKHHVDHAIRLSEAMLMLHASTNHEQLETLRHYRIRVFKSHEAIPAGGKIGVDCREVSNFLSPMLFGFNKFFALGSPEYCCDATQVSAIVEENQMRWGGGSNVAPNYDAAKFNREIEELKKKYKEMTANYTGATGREGKLKAEIKQMEAHLHILVALANKATREFTHPLAKQEITRQYKAIGKTLGVENAPGNYIEIFRKAMPKEYINHGGAPTQIPERQET